MSIRTVGTLRVHVSRGYLLLKSRLFPRYTNLANDNCTLLGC